MSQADAHTDALSLRARCGDVLAVGEMVVPKWDPQWFHLASARVLQELIRFARFKGARGGIPRAIISQPRRTGKSLLGSELTPATALGCSPGLRVMASAYSAEMVSIMIDNTKTWMGHDAYRRTFPTRLGSIIDAESGRTVKAKDAATEFRTLIEHPDGTIEPGRGSFRAVGVAGGATGHGHDLGIIDDWVKNSDQAYSRAHRKQIEDFYATCFESGAEGVAGMLAAQTMWRQGDFLQWLWDLWTSQGYDVPWLRYSAIYDPTLRRDVDVVTLDGRRIQIVDPRTEPVSLWPAKFSTQGYEKVRDGLILQGRRHVWDALYQQAPTGAGGVLFPRERWRWFDSKFGLDALQEIYLSVDPNSKATGKSFGCIGVWGVIDHPVHGLNYFRLDAARGHWDYADLRAEVVRIASKWIKAMPKQWRHPRSKIYVEDKANGPALLADDSPGLMGLRQWLCPVPKGRSKEACYREAAAIMRDDSEDNATGQGRVWLPLESFGRAESGGPLVTHDWTTGEGAFIDELWSQQPVSEPNDQADECAQILICRTFGLDRLRSL